jgi:membrane associated rhomboid family serine protease
MTLVIIIATFLISISAFPASVGSIDSLRRSGLFDKFKFNAYMVYHRKEWWRMFSSGLIHADWMHLIFNMLTLYFFGDYVEQYFRLYFGKIGVLYYLLLYVIALGASSIHDLIKYKNQHYYNAVGASGAVSAVLFASILFDPRISIYLFFIPIPIPGFIFGPLYLLYSQYMSKKNMDNIGHNAHFWGAVFGFMFPLFFNPILFKVFINQIF